MAKREQVWIGGGLGLLGLLALFGVPYVLSGGSGIALDGDHLSSGDGTAIEAGDGADIVGDETTSGGSGDGGSRVALRVVTDGAPSEAAASDAATASPSTPSSSSNSAPATTTTSAPAASSTSTSSRSSSTAPTTAASPTTGAPTAAQDSSSSSPSTTATTAASSTTRPPTTASDSSSTARRFEQEVIRLTNEERAAGGCGPLTDNGKLHAAALGHSVDMVENDFFSHTSPDGSSMVDRIERQGYQWRSLAENIAAGHRSPAAVVDGWMNSPDHRDNIMNCNLTEIGVGFHDYRWTQNLGAPR